MMNAGRLVLSALLCIALGACAARRTPVPGETVVLLPQQPSEEGLRTADNVTSETRRKELTEKLRTLYGDNTLEASLDPFYSKTSTPGLTARGVIVDETKSQLSLDIAPCTGVIATFHEPYVKRDAGEVTCNGKKYVRKEVEQRIRLRR
jgi:hypothetical protein